MYLIFIHEIYRMVFGVLTDFVFYFKAIFKPIVMSLSCLQNKYVDEMKNLLNLNKLF